MTYPLGPLQLRIRPMQARDVPAVVAIDRLSFSLPWPENAYYYELYENNHSLHRVAEATLPDGSLQVLGAIVIWLILDEAHIATLAVHPDYRRQRIAYNLLAAALLGAMRAGAQMATLEVRANNLAAQALYQYFELEEVGRRVRYYKDNNEDALIMSTHTLGQEYARWLEGLDRTPVILSDSIEREAS